jgi:hypothetical protein
LILVLAGACLGGEPPDPSTVEYRLKASFVLNFARFTEWPLEVSGSPADALVIGVLGTEAVAQEIEEVLRGEVIDHRRLAVKRLRPGQPGTGCQALFVSRQAKEDVPGLLRSLKGVPVLTISEVDGFCQRGGMLNFYLKDNKVRFEANPGAAAAAGLRISSKMLHLAEIVKTDG